MAEYPTEFEFEILLKDGRAIQLRPIRPDDAERERQFFTRVGPESAYFRFFLHKSDLSPDELRFYTTVDYEERMAFIAVTGDDMVAVGRYDMLPDHVAADGEKVAEVAFLVQDDHQGQGIGRHLLSALTTYARRKGISEFEAYVLAGNRGMLRLLRSSGHALLQELELGVYTVEIPFGIGHLESDGPHGHDEAARQRPDQLPG